MRLLPSRINLYLFSCSVAAYDDDDDSYDPEDTDPFAPAAYPYYPFRSTTTTTHTARRASSVPSHLDAAWYYPEPKDAARQIAGRVAFWRGVVVSE